MQINLTYQKAEISVLILVEDESEAYLITDYLNSINDYSYLVYHASSIKSGKAI